MLPQTATVAGLDVEHPLGDQWRLTALATGSVVTGSSSAISDLQTAFPRTFQRPDADHLTFDPDRTSLTGWAAEANLLKTDGEHWTGGMQLGATSPGFDANDLGFQSRADYASATARLTYSEPAASRLFQSWEASLIGNAAWTFGGELVRSGVAAEAQAQLPNFWQIGISGDVVPRRDDDRLTRGGPITRRDAGGSISLNVSTDGRKPVVASASGGYFGNELGRVGIRGSAGVQARPTDAFSVSLEPSVFVSVDPRQYVTTLDDVAAVGTFGRRYVFGQLDATSLSVEARVDWTFRPNLTLQLFARPFASRGRYSAFRQVDRPGAFRFPQFGVDVGTTTTSADGSTTIDPGDGGDRFTLDRDFTVRSLQGNAVLRWEYRPGSALFLVWQQQRNGSAEDGMLNFDRDLGGLFTDPLTNVFLIKLSYWLG